MHDWAKLDWLTFNGQTRKERIDAKTLVDGERARLSELDRLQPRAGPSRLYEFTVTYLGKETNNMAKAPGSGRGRPKKPAASAPLVEALDFIDVATSDFQHWQKFIRLSGNMAIAFNGQIAAGHPIAEELTLCPQLDKFKIALNRCGKSLTISETPSGQISVKGDKLRALVQCLTAEDLPYVQPDAQIVPIGEIIKETFKVCGVLASEAAERVMEASLLLEANSCTGTNGAAILQHWHGVDLPPAMVLPKVFTAGIAKQTKALVGFGFSWNVDQTQVASVTFWFEGGAWIKAQCYADKWQDVNSVLNVQSVPSDTQGDLFEAIEAVSHFNEDGFVTFAEGKIMSHDTDAVGAQYPVKGLNGGKKFNGKLIKTVAPYAAKIDLTSYPDRAFFFGGTAENPVRGAIMGLKAIVTESEPQEPEHPGEFDQSAEEPGNEGWNAN